MWYYLLFSHNSVIASKVSEFPVFEALLWVHLETNGGRYTAAVFLGSASLELKCEGAVFQPSGCVI